MSNRPRAPRVNHLMESCFALEESRVEGGAVLSEGGRPLKRFHPHLSFGLLRPRLYRFDLPDIEEPHELVKLFYSLILAPIFFCIPAPEQI